MYAYDYRNSDALPERIGTDDACIGSTPSYSSCPSTGSGA